MSPVLLALALAIWLTLTNGGGEDVMWVEACLLCSSVYYENVSTGSHRSKEKETSVAHTYTQPVPEQELPSWVPPRPAHCHLQTCEHENKCHSTLLRAILFWGGLLHSILAARANIDYKLVWFNNQILWCKHSLKSTGFADSRFPIQC